jgi:TonB family protein
MLPADVAKRAFIGLCLCVGLSGPRKAKVQGTIVLSVVVSEDGRTAAMTVVSGLGLGLTKKAIEAVSGWRFKPANTSGGEPVAVIVPVEVTMRCC